MVGAAELTSLVLAFSGRRLGGFIVAAGAIFLSAAWLGSAIITRRHRAEIANTYRQTGGTAYTVAQVGCAAMMGLLGIVLFVIVLLSAP